MCLPKKKKKNGKRMGFYLRCRSAGDRSNVGGIEAVEVVIDIGHIISHYQAGEGDKDACGEELHGDVFCFELKVDRNLCARVCVCMILKMSGL